VPQADRHDRADDDHDEDRADDQLLYPGEHGFFESDEYR